MTHADILRKPSENKTYGALGFGAMRLPGVSDTVKMTDRYLEAGFNYFDTAYVYGGSEEKLKKTLTSRHKRDTYMVASKVPPWQVREQKQCDKILGESLKRCELDYFDFYLVHSIDDENAKNADKVEIYDWVSRQKEKGLVKHVGFSFHGTAELLEKILTAHPEMEFVQLQLNYIDVLRGQAGQFQEIAIKHDTPIIVMEPVKGGMLAKLPAAAEKLMKAHLPGASIASWAIRYAAALSGATCVLSGMSSLSQMEDNLKTYAPLTPLNEKEAGILEAVLDEMAKVSSIPCTACKYCLMECPQQIAISDCFSMYNNVKNGAESWNQGMLYGVIPKGSKAADCTACGACIPRCPQHIDVPKELKKVAGMFK